MTRIVRNFLLPIFLAFSLPSLAASYYVSPTGSNSNSCLSGSPCLTIAYTSTKTAPGDVVHVAPGTYTGDFAISVSGNSSNQITYISDTKWGAKLVGSGGSVVWQVNASYITIQNFDVSGANRYGIYAGWSGGTPHHDQFLGNYIHDITVAAGCDSTGGGAINTGSGGTGYDQIIGNVVFRIGASYGGGSCYTIQGLYISNTNATVKNNLVGSVASYGIQQWHAATASTIVNNTVFNCRGGILLGDGDSGALPGGSANNYVANNISAGNNTYGIVEGGTMGSGNTYANNVLFNNPTGYSLVSGTTPTGTITSDPLFVNYQANGTGDYHLQVGSPAIGAGVLTNAPATDLDGNAQTSPAVIGAYVYAGTFTVPGPLPTFSTKVFSATQLVTAPEMQITGAPSNSTDAITLDYLNNSGRAATATAFAGTPTKCSAGNYPLGVDAQGNAQDCTAAGGGTQPFVVVPTANGTLLASQVLVRASIMGTVTLPTNCADATHYTYMIAETVPTADATFKIQRCTNSSNTSWSCSDIGTAIIRAGKVGSVTSDVSCTQTTFSAGDMLKVLAPSSVDTTLANVGGDIYATR